MKIFLLLPLKTESLRRHWAEALAFLAFKKIISNVQLGCTFGFYNTPAGPETGEILLKMFESMQLGCTLIVYNALVPVGTGAKYKNRDMVPGRRLYERTRLY